MGETTIKDIARECGVAVSTVSRAINNHPDINQETKRRILDMIEKTGFIPNNSARNLKRSEAMSIAFMVKGISNPMFNRMIHYMETYATGRGYLTTLHYVGMQDNEVQEALALVKEKRLKGIIFLGGAFEHDEQELSFLNVPYVFSTIGAQAQYANVTVDDIQESRKMVTYLLQQGHRRIGVITENLEVPSVGRLRVEGYRKALEEYDIPYDGELVYELKDRVDPYSMQNGYDGAKELLRKNPDITAIYCIADVLAIGACRAIRESGRQIPEDISVAGYDGIDTGAFITPQLTTIVQPVEDISKESIRLLLDMIDEKSGPRTVYLPGKLMVRESSGRKKVS